MSTKVKAEENKWLGRSLTNYKEQHKGTAESKGVYKEFMSAKTLTIARRILSGQKRIK